MNKRQKKKKLKQYNMRLCERYPFLIPRNRFTDKVVEHYDFTWTELEDMSPGWKKAFGLMMCEEIRDVLIESDYLYKYRISQIKEKYAQLRWYDYGAPEGVHDIIRKYEYISQFICQYCGKLDTPTLTEGWLEVICKDCYDKRKKIVRYKAEKYEDALKIEKKIGNSFVVHRFSMKSGDIDEVIDISDTIEKIRSGYHVKI